MPARRRGPEPRRLGAEAGAKLVVDGREDGHGVACCTGDGNVAREFSRLIGVGLGGIDVSIPLPKAWQGFGGRKRSLTGDMHANGYRGMCCCTKQNSIMLLWP